MNDGVQIRLLGDFEVRIGDRIIRSSDFERRSGAELVQLLALSPQGRLHREQILDAFWPDAPLDSSANRLHKAATYARKALGIGDSLVLRGEMVHLLPEVTATIDVAIVAEAARSKSVAGIAEALELCVGELLPEVLYEDWVVRPRETHRQNHVSLLEAAGRWRELVELDPVNEGAYCHLISDAIQFGDRTKALSLYQQLEAALEEQLGVSPSEVTQGLRDDAEHMTALLYSAAGLSGKSLRRPDIDIIGRDEDISGLETAIKSTRLVTLVGSGGSGKTHLARHVAALAKEQFVSGGWLAQFGTVADSSGVEQQLLSAIGGQRHADATVAESIVRSLEPLSALIVFDNCEHLVQPIAKLARAILESCPGIHILATSRESLGLVGEHIWPVATLARTSSSELFCRRASEHGVDLDANDPAIRAICRQLDDLPLALELAAARTRSLSVAEIESLLDERFDYLRSSGASAREHHQTLRAAIAWSIDALDTELRATICDLSVFADAFSLSAAQAVVGKESASQAAIVDRLDELHRRSVLQRVDHDGVSAFRLLESMRLYVRGLQSTDDAADRHLQHILQRFDRLERDHDDRPSLVLAAFDREWNDIRAAFGHALASDRRDDAVQLVASCAVYAAMTMRFELLDWVEALFPDDVQPNTTAEARAVAGWAALLSFRGDYERGSTLAEAALATAPDDDLALTALGWSHAAAGQLREADDLVRQIIDPNPTQPTVLRANALVLRTIFAVMAGRQPASQIEDIELYASGGDDVYEMVYGFVAGCVGMRDNPNKALASLSQSMVLSDRLGMDLSSIGNRSLTAIGLALVRSPVDALLAIREALSWAAERGMWSSTMNDFTTAAIILDGAGRTDVSIALLSARHHSGFAEGFGTDRSEVTEQLREADPDLFARCWQRGMRLDARSATTFALRTIDELLVSLSEV